MQKGKIVGLTIDEVKERELNGKTNVSPPKITKSTKDVLKDNICTLFNLYNLIIAIVLMMVGAWSNCFFLLIILVNTSIGIIQELHTKKLVEELSLLSAATVDVLRDGTEESITLEKIVIDDVIILEAGKQIPADCDIICGSLEVNESMLSGESDAIMKNESDFLYSGSFVISGKAYAKVKHVGEDNYMNQMASDVKKHTQVNSELMISMQKVTKITGFLIVPLGALLLYQSLFLRNDGIEMAVVSTAAALLGMLPKGLMLLTSISLATGTQRLAKKNVLVQELYALETLAHVDVLCLDKTGTLSEGKMKVEDVILEEQISTVEFESYMRSFLYASDDNNATFSAIQDYFGKEEVYQSVSKVAFSSQRKWSSVSLKDKSVIIGAPDILLKGQLPLEITRATGQGKRVLIIGLSNDEVSDQCVPDIETIATLILSDPIRENAKETLAFFEDEGVEIKIISGDTIDTVSALASQAGFSQSSKCVDCSKLSSDEEMKEAALNNAVFGRVTPHQKKLIVQALQSVGKTVAMSGDGVNDLLALKEADCSIAIAEGSDAAKQISQLVLVDSNFASLPSVLAEGRRVVNNVTNLASVFFVKTIYSFLLSIVCLLFAIPFPFIPIQITLIDLAIEGYPAFFLSFESNNNKIKGSFLTNVFRSATPFACSFVIVFLCILLARPLLPLTDEQLHLLQYMLVSSTGMLAVIKSCIPFNKLRVFLTTTMFVGFYVAVALFHSLLKLPLPQSSTLLWYVIFLTITILLSWACFKVYHVIELRLLNQN